MMKCLFRRTTGLMIVVAMLFALSARVMAKNVEDYHLFLTTFNTSAVENDPPEDIYFSLDKRTLVEAITTYHWNNGRGAAPGTIRIYKDDVLDGEWQASGRSGSGASNVFWDVFPDYILEPGHDYEIVPSSRETWSYNSASEGRGFIELRGHTVDAGFTVSGTTGGYKCSDWAKGEVKNAAGFGIIPSALQNADLTKPMSRKDFAALSVNAYSYMSGKSVSPAENPFTDTSDSDVLRAYNAGIINGTSDTTFSPSANVTREQAATMLTRAYKKIVLSGWTLKNDADFALSYNGGVSFSDSGSISDFAKESVSFMASKGILNGVDDSHFDPSNSVTTEQALAIAVRMIKNLDTSPQQNAKTDTGSEAKPGELTPANGGAKVDEITVTFGGKAAIVKDSTSDKPDDSTIAVYDLAFDQTPAEAVSLAFDAPALSDCDYLIQIGVPVKDNAGNEGTIWSGIKTVYENGQAKASAYMDGLEEYIGSISGDSAATLQLSTAPLGMKITNMPGLTAVKVALTKEIRYSNDKFVLHVPYEIYNDPSDKASKIYFSDQSAQNLLNDLKSILEYYGSEYDISPRTTWPMDVYFGDFPSVLEYVGISSPLAYFAMPAYSLGGRFFNNAINDSYIKLSQKSLKNGYMLKPKSDSSTYGTLAHELFHFVQRCYYSKTSLWWDESSATYYDALMQDRAGYKSSSPRAWLDQNYWQPAIVQYEIIPNAIDGGSDGDYAHMPFFHYCMKEDSTFLKRAFESLKNNKSQSWTDLITSVTGKTMQEVADGYYTSLVCKGELYSDKNLPWDIYDDMNEFKGTYSAVGGTIRMEEGTETYFTAVPAYGASFMALDMSKLPASCSSINASVKDVTLIDITVTGKDYDHVSFNVHKDGKAERIPIDGAKHLLMFVNGTGSVVSPTVSLTLNKAFNAGGGFASTKEQIENIPKQYKGTITYLDNEGGIHTSAAKLKLIVSHFDYGASMQLTSDDGVFSYTDTDLVYSPATGMCSGKNITVQLEDSGYNGGTDLYFSLNGAGVRVHMQGYHSFTAVFTGNGGGVELTDLPVVDE